MRRTSRTLIGPLIALAAVACAERGGPGAEREAMQRNVEAYQRALITGGVTAGSVAGVFRGRDTLAYAIVNSGLDGDTPISPNTIFPLHSMSKPITIVAMMIPHERGGHRDRPH